MVRALRAIFRWILYILVISQGAIFYNGSVVHAFDHRLYIFLALCFGDFSPLSACLWWICLLHYYITLHYNYKIHLITVTNCVAIFLLNIVC
jgi:hypothetical protein